jgi:hypothetical protein
MDRLNEKGGYLPSPHGVNGGFNRRVRARHSDILDTSADGSLIRLHRTHCRTFRNSKRTHIAPGPFQFFRLDELPFVHYGSCSPAAQLVH